MMIKSVLSRIKSVSFRFIKSRLFHVTVTLMSISILSTPCLAGVHFSIKGSAISSNYLLQSQNKDALSGSVDVDVGSHLRVGLTHRVEQSSSEGYERDCSDCPYYFQKAKTYSTANSVDLTVILFYGQLFLPYLKLGIVKKDYVYRTEVAGVTSETPVSMPEVPNAGAGVGIKLSRRFSLNLSYTRSPGYLLRDPEDAKSAYLVMDSYASVGISYQM